MTYYPPMERVLYNLHFRMCTFALRSSSHASRGWAERTLLLFSICGFGALYMSHRAFVYRRSSTPHYHYHHHYHHHHHHAAASPSLATSGSSHNIPLTCLPSIPGFTRHEAAITHIILLDERATEQNISSYAYTIQNRTLVGHSFIPPGAPTFCSAGMEPSTAAVPAYKTCQEPPTLSSSRHLNYHHYQQQQIYFSYSQVKGYLLLPPTLVQERHDLAVQYVHVSPTDSKCFGEPFLQELVFRLLSPETVIVNWLLGLEDPQGYAYHPRTDTLVDLHPTKERLFFLLLGNAIGSKLSVVLRTCFLFLICTTLVSFTLRETQERMLDFTQQLHHHVRHGRSVVHLVTRHLIDNLVFCPIMVGMIFFLIEFYHGDKALAFMVLSIVWLAEVFSVISLRSTNGLHFFPRIFFLLFSLFHFYLFSFPFGFTHTALACTTCFMIHSMLFFWHRYELPAVALGRVSPQQPRMRSRSFTPPPPPPGSWWNEIPPPLRGEPASSLGGADPTANTPLAHNGHHYAAHVTPRMHTTSADTPQLNTLSSAHDDSHARMGSGNSLSTLSAGHVTPQHQPQYARYPPQRSPRGQGGSILGGSHHSNSSHNNLSRPTSSSVLYGWTDDPMTADGDDSSFQYFMGGEVVVPRTTTRVPDHVVAATTATTSSSSGPPPLQQQTPVRDNLARNHALMGPDHPRTRTAPALSPEWT